MHRVVLILGLLLAGCMSAGKRGSESLPAVYDLGPPLSSLQAAPRRSVLALEVKAPLWFDTPGIDYRLKYNEPARLREYALSRWAGSPVQLVQQRLQQRLAYLPAAQGRADCLLRVELSEFSQVFSTPETSAGVVQGRAWLLDRTRRPLAELPLLIERPAASADAQGGVAAIAAAVDALAEELLRWEKQIAAEGRLAACGS